MFRSSILEVTEKNESTKKIFEGESLRILNEIFRNFSSIVIADSTVMTMHQGSHVKLAFSCKVLENSKETEVKLFFTFEKGLTYEKIGYMSGGMEEKNNLKIFSFHYHKLAA